MSTIAMSGPLPQDRVHERVSLLHRVDHVEAVVAQEPRETVAQEREVLGDHHAQGITARTVVGPPPGLETVRTPSSASTRCRRPVSPAPAGSAPPRPSSRHLEHERVVLAARL